MKSVKFLSMTFILLGFDKVGFCEMFVNRGALQRSGREVLREVILKKLKHYFLCKLCHSLRFISHILSF